MVTLRCNFKVKSDELFKDLGTDTTTAIRMFLTQALAVNGFPFEIKRVSVTPYEALSEIEMLDKSNRENLMRQILAPLKKEYDYILIDCSPSLGLITINALTASDSVIIPVQCEFFALEGIAKLLNTIKIIKSNLNPALRIEGFLLTMYDARLRLSAQVHDEVRRHFGDLVFNTVIARNVRLSEAPSHGLSVLQYDKNSKGAKNYINLAKELIRRNKA